MGGLGCGDAVCVCVCARINVNHAISADSGVYKTPLDVHTLLCNMLVCSVSCCGRRNDEMLCDRTFDLHTKHMSVIEHLQLDTLPISFALIVVIRPLGDLLQSSSNKLCLAA